MSLDSSIGLIYTLTGRVDDGELKKFSKTVDDEADKIESRGKNALNGLAKSLGFSAEQTAQLSAALPIAGAALAGLAATAVGTASALFAIAKSASDYGSQIKDASDMTGLHAETLSAMRYAADQSGISIEEISKSVGKFSKLVAESAQGSEEAAKKLKALGVDPKEAINDLDGSLSKVIERIHNLENPIVRGQAAMDAFGEKGGKKLLGFIKQFDGDLPGLIEKAKQLGITLSDDDVNAADDFGDQLAELQAIANSVGFQFAKEFMPDITNAMKDVGDWFSKNQDTVRAWGREVRNEIYAAIDLAEKLAKLWKILVAPDWESIKKEYNRKTSADVRNEEKARQQGFYNPDEMETRMPGANTVLTPIAGKSDDDLDYLSETSVAKKAKKAGKTAAENFEEGFREFAKDNDFIVGSVLRTGKQINKGSKHASGEAGDLKIGGKSSEEIVNVIAEGLKKGYRVVDEQLGKGSIPGVNTTGPNVHFESAGSKKSSLFIDRRPDLYGGQAGLNYLKKLDLDRRNKKTSSDEIAEFAKKQVEDEKKANEEKVKDREAADRRVLENARNVANEQKAINDKLLAQKTISQDEFDKRSEQSAIDLLTKEKNLLDERLKLAQSLGVDTVDIEQEIANKVSEIKIKQSEAETAAYLKSKKYLEDLKQLRLEVAKAQADSLEEDRAQQRKKLEKEVDRSFGKDRLDALVILQQFEIKENQRRRDEAVDRAKDERDAALLTITDKDKEKEKVDEINLLYKARLDLINQIHVADDENTNEEFDPKIRQEQTGGGFFGTLAGGLGDLIGGGVDPLKQITQQGEYTKAVYADLKSVSKDAIGSMVQGLGQLAATWITTGKFSAKAALQMASGIITGLAIQSGIKALFELAEGYAALANPFTAALAPMHFAAAKTYGLVAAAAGIAGIGLGVTSRAFDKAAGTGENNPITKEFTNGGNRGDRGNRGSVGAYSSYGDEVKNYENGVSAPEQRIVLELRSNDSHIITTVKNAMEQNDFRMKLKNVVLEENNGY